MNFYLSLSITADKNVFQSNFRRGSIDPLFGGKSAGERKCATSETGCICKNIQRLIYSILSQFTFTNVIADCIRTASPLRNIKLKKIRGN